MIDLNAKSLKLCETCGRTPIRNSACATCLRTLLDEVIEEREKMRVQLDTAVKILDRRVTETLERVHNETMKRIWEAP